MSANSPATDPFVSPEWLTDHPEALLVDVRWYLDGREALPIYEAGHLPGARFVDLDTDLSDPPGSTGRHPLPSPAGFSAAMQRLGISADSVVVCYDDTGGITAGRMWWMLDSVGVEAYVLAGGIDTWPGQLATGPDQVAGAGTLVVAEWPADRYVDIELMADLAEAKESAGPVVLDARAATRYAGDENPIDPRFGHIPGARSAPALSNLVDGRPRSAQELEAHYRARGVDSETDVIAYCGSGVSANLDLLALRRLGNTSSRLYVGSWSEWGSDSSRPIETEAAGGTPT